MIPRLLAILLVFIVTYAVVNARFDSDRVMRDVGSGQR